MKDPIKNLGAVIAVVFLLGAYQALPVAHADNMGCVTFPEDEPGGYSAGTCDGYIALGVNGTADATLSATVAYYGLYDDLECNGSYVGNTNTDNYQYYWNPEPENTLPTSVQITDSTGATNTYSIPGGDISGGTPGSCDPNTGNTTIGSPYEVDLPISIPTASYPNGTYTLFVTVPGSGCSINSAPYPNPGPYGSPSGCYQQSSETTFTVQHAVSAPVITPPSPTTGSISITAISPNPATNQITVSGSATGPIVEGGGKQFCPGPPSYNYIPTVPSPLGPGANYSIDGNGAPAFTLNQTQPGAVVPCPGIGGTPTVQPYRYSFSFTDNTDIAGLSNGTHNLQVCVENDGGSGSLCTSQPFAVNNVSASPPTGQGTITVLSANAVTGGGVYAVWDIYGGSSYAYSGGVDLCNTGITCAGTAQTYNGVPATDPNGNPGVAYSFIPNAASSPLYSFDSVQRGFVAQKKISAINSLLSLTQSIFGSTAKAYVIPPSNPQNATLFPQATVPFVVLWDPIAGMATSPTSLYLSASAGGSASGQIQIVNNGAPGSTLTWSSASDASWLSASPASDGSGITNGASGNASENVTINAASLPVGNYTGHINFVGSSSPGAVPPGSINASLTVSYSVTAAASPASTVDSVQILNCNPSSVNTGVASTCTASVSGSGSYDPSVSWNASLGTASPTGPDTSSFSSPTPGTATITACSNQSGYTNVCDTAQVSVASAPAPDAVNTVTITGCNPSTIDTTQSSDCSAMVTGTGNYDGSVTWSSSFGAMSSIDADDAWFSSPDQTGTATITACSNQPGYTNVCDTTQVFVTTPPQGGTVTSVTITGCNPSTIDTTEASQCSATVTGTGSYNGAVAWGQPNIGSMSPTDADDASFSSPDDTGTATITACSTQTPSLCDSTQVTVNPGALPPPTAPPTATTVTNVTIVSCNPSPVNTGVASTCTASVNGTGNYDPSVTWGSSFGVISSSGADNGQFSSPTPGTATITACSNQPGYTSSCDTTQVTVNTPAPPACTPGVTCPRCTNPILNASPTSIVVPESSVLSYSCQNVNQCTLTGSDGSSYPVTWSTATVASGTQPVDPAMTTVYTLTCTNTNYSPSSATVSAPVQVTVGNTSRCEQNPNGAGCPGQ